MRLQLYPQLQIVYVLVWHAITISVATGSFTSTPAHVGGVLKACVGDQISLTCSHDDIMGNGQTRWLFSPPVDCDFLIDHFQPNNAQPCGPFTLQDVSETTGGMVLNSTVVVIASTSISCTVAECRDASGTSYNEIGRTSICVIDQPTNLTVVDGTQVYWNGTVCADSETTYRVVVTLVSDSQPTEDPIETTSTMTVLSGILPNQEYTVSVSAYGSSCVSNPATVNFTSPANVSSPSGTDSNLTRTTTAQLFTGQQSTDEEQKQSVGTSVGLAVGLTFLFLILIVGGAILVIAIVIVVVMKIGLTHQAKHNNSYIEGNTQTGQSEPDEKQSSPVTEEGANFYVTTPVDQPRLMSGVNNESTVAGKLEDVSTNDNLKLLTEEPDRPTSVEESKPPPKPPRARVGAARQSNTSEEMNPS